MLLRRLTVDVTAHGFRSSFRDWCSEATGFPREVAEMALAHTIADKVEASYRRGDLFEKRRKVMDAWASFVTAARGKVIPIGKRQY
jgi:integrase